MTLEGLEAIGDLEKLPMNSEEILELLSRAERKLADSCIKGNSNETRIALAYTVILICATIALRASGYRVKNKQEFHYIAIETLRYTLKVQQQQIDYFQDLREKRHHDLYGGSLFIMENDVEEAIQEANALLKLTKTWLKDNNSDLLR